MTKFLTSQLFIAVITYLLFIFLITPFVLSYLQKIKTANQNLQGNLSTYLNWQFNKDGQPNLSPLDCEGDLFFKADSPIGSLFVNQDLLYLSHPNNKLTTIDLKNANLISRYESPFFADIYSKPGEDALYGAQLLDNKLMTFSPSGSKIETNKVHTKVGRVSSVAKDKQGYIYMSGYASGNLMKMTPQTTILASSLDKIVDLEVRDQFIYIARFNSNPSLLKIDLKDKNKFILDTQKSFSSLVSDGKDLYVGFGGTQNSEIGKIIDDQVVSFKKLNCPSPIKLTIYQDKIFYTSLMDQEGKVYSTRKNLQTSGK